MTTPTERDIERAWKINSEFEDKFARLGFYDGLMLVKSIASALAQERLDAQREMLERPEIKRLISSNQDAIDTLGEEFQCDTSSCEKSIAAFNKLKEKLK